MNKQEYLLLCLAEECNELSQNAIKCLRFTTEHHYYELSNIERVQLELTDVMSVLHLLEEELHLEFNKNPSQEKINKLQGYMVRSQQLGTLEWNTTIMTSEEFKS